MNLPEFYAAIGAEMKDVLRRLGSEGLIQKYLLKLPNDPTYVLLTNAMQKKDYEQAFRAAHTLKGIALNLGLTPLHEVSQELMELLRNGSPDLETADVLLQQVSDVYQSILAKIKKIAVVPL